MDICAARASQVLLWGSGHGVVQAPPEKLVIRKRLRRNILPEQPVDTLALETPIKMSKRRLTSEANELDAKK